MSISLAVKPENLVEVIEFFTQKDIYFHFDNNYLKRLIECRVYEVLKYIIEYKDFHLLQIAEDCLVDGVDYEAGLDVMKHLIEWRLDTDDASEALSGAVSHSLAATKFLIKKYTGNVKKLLNSDNCDILEFTISRCHEEDVKLDIIKLLIKHGADISKCKKDPIIFALSCGRIELAKYLLTVGSCLSNITMDGIREIYSENLAAIEYLVGEFNVGNMLHLEKSDWKYLIDEAIANDDYAALKILSLINMIKTKP